MSWWRDFFSWTRSRGRLVEKTKIGPRRPQDVDYSEPLVVNKALTSGLYHNTYPGLKLAGAMAYTPIAVPIWFMGVPTPQAEDDATQETLNALVETMYRRMLQIHLEDHRDGTIWVFPKFSARKGALVWEFISDDAVCDIIRDLDTLEPVKIITDENIILQVGENDTAHIRRKRIYTREKIEYQWLSGKDKVPQELRDQTYRNVLGILPIPFANNADGDEIRGHSDYERILPDMKDYHDIDLKQSTVLAKFEPKLKLKVKNVGDWLTNNGEEANCNLSNLDLFRRDLLFCVEDEDADYVYPETAHEAYERALDRKFKKISEGGQIPVLFYGVKMAGNDAGAQQQMNNVVKFVEDKRDQKNESYTKLFEASLALLSQSTMSDQNPRIKKIEWNRLDALSDEMKAKMIKDIAQGFAYLVDKASATKEMLFKLWEMLFPGVAPEKLDEFVKGLADMAKHKQFTNLDYEIGADMTGDPIEDMSDDDGASTTLEPPIVPPAEPPPDDES